MNSQAFMLSGEHGRIDTSLLNHEDRFHAMEYTDASQPNTPKAIVTQWLQDNFEPAESASMPRSTVYKLYENYCQLASMECFNAASFGKLIRTVFTSLKTRRLGTRGKSKYHYYGIQIKPTSNLINIVNSNMPEPSSTLTQNKLIGKKRKHEEVTDDGYPKSMRVISLPQFVVPEDHSLSCSEHLPHFTDYLIHYHTHCNTLVNWIERSVEQVEKELVNFYGQTTHLSHLLECLDFVDLLMSFDEIVWEVALHVLVPDVIESLKQPTNHARNVATKLLSIVEAVIVDCPSVYRKARLDVTRKFCNRLYSHHSIRNLSGIFQQILRTPQLVSQMIVDYNATDFSFLNSKAKHSLNVDTEILDSFFLLHVSVGLKEAHSVDKWLERFGEVIEKLATAWEKPSEYILSTLAAYLSVIMNDLTVRNAESFGSFHIMRTLFEEFVSYYFDRPGHTSFSNPLPRGVTIHIVEPEEPVPKQLVNYPWPEIDSESPNGTYSTTQISPATSKLHVANPVLSYVADYRLMQNGNTRREQTDTSFRDNVLSHSERRIDGDLPTDYYFTHENIQRNSPFEFAGDFDGRAPFLESNMDAVSQVSPKRSN